VGKPANGMSEGDQVSSVVLIEGGAVGILVGSDDDIVVGSLEWHVGDVPGDTVAAVADELVDGTLVGDGLGTADGDAEGSVDGAIQCKFLSFPSLSQCVLPIMFEESGQAMQGVELLDWRPSGCW
jgi:hypothetical protein